MEVGEGVTLVCVVEGLEGEGEVVWNPVPEGAVMSGYNLSFEAVETQNFTCSVGNYSDFYVLTVGTCTCVCLCGIIIIADDRDLPIAEYKIIVVSELVGHCLIGPLY